MSVEYYLVSFAIAVAVFAAIYWGLYIRYRNVNKKYQVVRDTRSRPLAADVRTSFVRRRKGLRNPSISGGNERNFDARVGRVAFKQLRGD